MQSFSCMQGHNLIPATSGQCVIVQHLQLRIVVICQLIGLANPLFSRTFRAFPELEGLL